MDRWTDRIMTPKTALAYACAVKIALANKTIYTLVWYALYNIWSGNGAGPILTAPGPTRHHASKPV